MITLMVNQLIKTLERRLPRTYRKSSELPPVLLLLDEFPRLGKIPSIVNGLTTLRSRGVTFALFIQSLAQLDEIYGEKVRSVIADVCEYKALLKTTDVTSQEYFSKLAGTSVSTHRSMSASHDLYTDRTIGYNRNIAEAREPNIYPHEFATLEDVVLFTPHGLCRVRKSPFFSNEEIFLRDHLEKNRDRVMRKILADSKNQKGDTQHV